MFRWGDYLPYPDSGAGYNLPCRVISLFTKKTTLKKKRWAILLIFYFFSEATTGLEPVIRVLQTRALPTWLRRRVFFERAKRFELSTFSLARRRSTTELHPQLLGQTFWPSAERQNRTDDTAIFSRVLYQLSYLGENIQLLSEWYSTRT